MKKARYDRPPPPQIRHPLRTLGTGSSHVTNPARFTATCLALYTQVRRALHPDLSHVATRPLACYNQTPLVRYNQSPLVRYNQTPVARCDRFPPPSTPPPLSVYIPPSNDTHPFQRGPNPSNAHANCVTIKTLK